jgi:hypothetical protein
MPLRGKGMDTDIHYSFPRTRVSIVARWDDVDCKTTSVFIRTRRAASVFIRDPMNRCPPLRDGQLAKPRHLDNPQPP